MHHSAYRVFRFRKPFEVACVSKKKNSNYVGMYTIDILRSFIWARQLLCLSVSKWIIYLQWSCWFPFPSVIHSIFFLCFSFSSVWRWCMEGSCGSTGQVPLQISINRQVKITMVSLYTCVIRCKYQMYILDACVYLCACALRLDSCNACITWSMSTKSVIRSAFTNIYSSIVMTGM